MRGRLCKVLCECAQKIIFSASWVLYGSPEPMPGAPYATPMVEVLAPNKGPLPPMLGSVVPPGVAPFTGARARGK